MIEELNLDVLVYQQRISSVMVLRSSEARVKNGAKEKAA